MQEKEQLEIHLEGKMNNKFVRFLIKSWQPVPGWRSTIIIFAVVAGIFLALGGVLLFINANIVEVSVQYDAKCEGKATCNIPITIPRAMEPPIFVYYGIDNFYQNHRTYIKSKSTKQLGGKSISMGDAQTDCDPVATNAEMHKTKSVDPLAPPLDPNAVAIPCGLIAQTFFTDTYKLYEGENPIPAKQIGIIEKGIAWDSDVKDFQNTNNMASQWLDMTDEHFIVWMRTSALPNFKKLWGRIGQSLQPGAYVVVINNNYAVREFGGAKRFVITTTGIFGGKNYFLPAACLIVGGFSFLMAIFFIIRWIRYNKKHR